jgi:hypothetical protein
MLNCIDIHYFILVVGYLVSACTLSTNITCIQVVISNFFTIFHLLLY